jgi:hypothetical protein
MISFIYGIQIANLTAAGHRRVVAGAGGESTQKRPRLQGQLRLPEEKHNSVCHGVSSHGWAGSDLFRRHFWLSVVKDHQSF